MQTSKPDSHQKRAERSDDWREVLEGLGGVAVIAAGLVTPFLRSARARWGMGRTTARRSFPGDDLIPHPRWGWTHGIEVDVPAEEAWPWIAQIGADRGGFYSYQWLENVAGCVLRNAEGVNAEWQDVHVGSKLVLHPDVPPLSVVAAEPRRYFVAHAARDPKAKPDGSTAWVEASWLFFVEPLGPKRCRVISRYRCNTSDDLATRFAFGPTLVEPIGFAMDRRMLLGIKQRCERAARQLAERGSAQHRNPC